MFNSPIKPTTADIKAQADAIIDSADFAKIKTNADKLTKHAHRLLFIARLITDILEPKSPVTIADNKAAAVIEILDTLYDIHLRVDAITHEVTPKVAAEIVLPEREDIIEE